MHYIRFFILFLFPVFVVGQQQYAFEHISVEDGLLSNPKVLTFQDEEGFYWFFSDNGIQRFDGKNFIGYKYFHAGTNSLLGDWTGIPLEDKEKNIWITCNEGLIIFNRIQRVLEHLNTGDSPDSINANVLCIGKDKTENIWIVTDKNIFSYDYSKPKPVLVQKIDSPVLHVIYDKDRNGFWIILANTPHKLTYFDCKTKKICDPFSMDIVKLFGYYNPISLFSLDMNDNIWISDYLGDLCKYNVNQRQITYYQVLHNRHKGKINLPNAAVRDCVDDGNTIWFTSDNFAGLLKYDKKKDSFSTIENENGSDYGLHYQSEGYRIFRDREGNIWINTDMGMNIFNPGQQQFKYISKTPNSSVKQFSTDITSFFESSKRDIWISTWGAGIFRYDSNLNLIHNYFHHKNDIHSLGEPFSRTWTIAEDEKGKIWVGSQYGMLSVLDMHTGRFTNRIIPEFEKRTIMFIVKDQKKNFWLALHNGFLAKWSNDSNKFSVFKNLYHDNENNIHAIDGICTDKKNNIWVGAGDDALDCFGETKNTIIKSVLNQHHIILLSLLNDSVIMGGTLNQGLFLYNINSGQSNFFTTENGLSSNIVFGALADDKNNVWILTNESIEMLNLSSKRVTKFGIDDGIRDHVFERVFYKLQNGTILAAANSGAIYFNPDSIRSVPPPPDVTITGLRISQKDISVDSALQYIKIKLPYNQNSIAVEFASLSFRERKNIQYYYKLEGTDQDWINAGEQHSVTYANLPTGNYMFKVMAKNRDGFESNHITSLIIVVDPPWWKTWWAFLIWVIIAAVIFYAVYDYLKKNRDELSVIRQKIATDLHDDIGSTLNSISVYSEIAGKQLQTNAEIAKEILVKMGVASRNMIDNMNDIVWAINPKNDQFENILQRMQYFAGELLSGKNILLQFNADEKAKTIKLPMEKRKNFYLIFKEAINNAYKYSNAKTVSVNIGLSTNEMIMNIEDDGSGFDYHQKTFGGNGLKNMQTRAREIDAQLNISTIKDKGTAIVLKMTI